jgi:hypothetical protein
MLVVHGDGVRHLIARLPNPGSRRRAHDSIAAKLCRRPRPQVTAYCTAELARHSGSATGRAERFSASGPHAGQAHEQVHLHWRHAGY